MKKFFGEFKEFISKGNVMDMAVGIIVGGAFTAIVSALTDNIINPLIGSIFKMDFSDLAVTINGAELKYGAFIMAVINFIIIAFVLFLIVKGMNTLRAKAEEKKKKEEVEAAPTTKVCPFCKMEVPIEATKCGHCTSDLPKEA